MKTENKIFISIDPGFDGFKVTFDYGKKKVGSFDLDSMIIDITNMTEDILQTESDSVYIKEENSLGKKTFVMGKEARSLMQGNKKVITEVTNSKDNYYKMNMQRFTSPLFQKALYGALYKVFDILREEEVEFNAEDIACIIEMPYSVFKSKAYNSNIKNFFATDMENYSFSTEDFKSEFSEIGINLSEIDVKFSAQATCALIGEYSDSNGQAKKVNGSDIEESLPAVIVDAGYKTVGFIPLDTSMSIQDSADSYEEFGMNVVTNRTAERLNETLTRKVTGMQIEALSRSNNPVFNDYKEGEGTVAYNAVDEIGKEVKIIADEMFDFYMDKHIDDMVSAKTIIVAGGSGEKYYPHIKKSLDEKKMNLDCLLAKAEYNGEELGSIYAVSIGGLKMLKAQYQQ